MTEAVPLAEIHRGKFLESLHLGHAVVARPNGEIVDAWGDPDLVVLPRSSIKMMQALPLLETGAGRDLSTERLALACASHSGERRHVEKVGRWLADIGLDEHALCCGPQISRNPELRDQMIRSGEPVTRLFNNCSGKHAGFLTVARHIGAGLDYVDPANPVQKGVREAFEDMCGEDSPGFGIDGCSAPNFAASLKGLAKAMARFAVAGQGSGSRDDAAARLRDAMMEHPELVSGTGRACARLMQAAGGRAAIKTGAEGFYTAILPELGLGVALKVADGATRASEVAIAAILVRLGVLDPKDPIVAGFLHRPILNWDGLKTGFERPAAGLLPA